MASLAHKTAAVLGLLLPSILLAAPHSFSLTPTMLDMSPRDAVPTNSTKAYTPPASYRGDVLNVTKCLCENPNPSPSASQSDGSLSQTFQWGHVYKFDYFNWHLQTLYTLFQTCNSDFQYSDDNSMLPTCWKRDAEKKACNESPDGNTLCYQIDPLTHHNIRQNEYYFFNDQKRGLPNPTGIMEPEMCGSYCRDNIGMDLARDANSNFTKTWKGGRDSSLTMKVHSEFETYENTDDMCAGCK